MGKVKEYFRKNSLKIFLIAVVMLFFIYVFSDNFRNYLLYKNIDPNFLVGFLMAITLILSIIQSLSDRRFGYNTNLVSSLEDKGIQVIAKLLAIRQKSEMLFIVIKNIKEAIYSDRIYIDTNNALSKDIERELEMTAAYMQTYFPEEGMEWNLLQEKLSKLTTNCGNVLLNYKENIEALKDPYFLTSTLNKIDQIIIESGNIHNDIDKSAEKMSARLVEKINDYKSQLKGNFYFKL